MSLAGGTLLAASAIFSHSFEISQVRTFERPNEQCEIAAQADDGALTAEVTWAPCSAIDVRVMSAADLEKAGQLAGLGMIRDVFLKTPHQVFLVAWGSHAATLYARSRKGISTTVEITLAD